ncbi:MAG: DUF2029 domain-containing protein [Streptosporangiaceae bacterium]|nr:DUF2029 domain-containing protein [Streptosporangiaceae bacterium]
MTDRIEIVSPADRAIWAVTDVLRRHWLFIVLLAAGLVLRGLAQLGYQPALLYIDSKRYLFGTDFTANQSASFDPLGYTLVVLRPVLAFANLGFVVFLQHIAGLAMAAALYVLLMRLGVARWLAALAVAPVLLDAYQVQAEQTIMPDVLFEALVVAGLVLLLWQPRPGLALVACGGLALGASAPVRQVGEVLIVPALAYVLTVTRPWRSRLLHGAVLAACFAVPAAGYLAYSGVILHDGYQLSGMGAVYLYGRTAHAADCATLKLPAAVRPLCPAPPVQARLGVDGLVNNPAAPRHTYAVVDPRTGRQISTSPLQRQLAYDVLRQQPLRVAGDIAADSVKIFALTRDTREGDTPVARWQFQLSFPYYPPLLTRYGANSASAVFRRAGGGTIHVWRPAAAMLRTYQLGGGYTPGPVFLLALLVGTAGMFSYRRYRDPRLALACLLVTGVGVATLLGADLYEFSWRYQLPALITLPVGGALGATAVRRHLRDRRVAAASRARHAVRPRARHAIGPQRQARHRSAARHRLQVASGHSARTAILPERTRLRRRRGGPSPLLTDTALVGASPATEPRDRGSRVLAAVGVVAAAAALGLFVAALAAHPAATLKGFDLGVYRMGGVVARSDPARLYTWQLRPGIQFTYTPFAALVFALVTWVPFRLLLDAAAAASAAALAATVWIAFRELGWRGTARIGATLLVTGLAFWTEPVQRALYLGQIELVLMALIVWDLSQPDRRWWKGAGTGIAAGIKLVPLIFIAYLLVTRRFRQAGVAAAAFLATVITGFAALPQDSVRWWFHGYFLQAGRTGFVGAMVNQSLRGVLTRLAGSVTGTEPWWLAAAIVTGIAGLTAAALLHRAGYTFAGLMACALTGLLISPISWDHHWVWVAPGIAVLLDAAVRAERRWARAAGLAGAAAVFAAFGAWPRVWGGGPGLLQGGLIWYAPGSDFSSGDNAGYAEYHWTGMQLIAGNLYVIVGGALLLAALGAAVSMLQARPKHARRKHARRRTHVQPTRAKSWPIPGSAGPTGRKFSRNQSRSPGVHGMRRALPSDSQT